MSFGSYPYESSGRRPGSAGNGIAAFFGGVPYAVMAGLMTGAGFLAIAAYGNYLASHPSTSEPAPSSSTPATVIPASPPPPTRYPIPAAPIPAPAPQPVAAAPASAVVTPANGTSVTVNVNVALPGYGAPAGRSSGSCTRPSAPVRQHPALRHVYTTHRASPAADEQTPAPASYTPVTAENDEPAPAPDNAIDLNQAGGVQP